MTRDTFKAKGHIVDAQIAASNHVCSHCGYEEPGSEQPVFEIKGSFSVYAIFRVPADNFEEALGKLCNKEIFTSFGGQPETYGFSNAIMDAEDITVEVECVDGDPSPTGRSNPREREWEYKEEGEADGNNTG